MSTVARPRGPLPARVYWVRRLAMLTVVLLMGWLMIRWIDGGDPGAAPPEDDTAAAAESDDKARTEKSDERSEDKVRTDRVRTVAESFERPSEPCDLTKVVAVPSVSDPVYAGEPVSLTLRISTSSSTACSLGIDAEHLLISITSGRDTVWDSTRCEDEIPDRELALQPRWSALVELTWSGQYSGRRCAPDSTAAEPGTYTVETAVLEGEPTEVEFEMIERPDPPEDDKDDKNKSDDDKTDSESDAGDSSGSDSSGSDQSSEEDTEQKPDEDTESQT